MRARPTWFFLLVLPLAIVFSLGDLHCAWMGGSGHGDAPASAAAAPAPGHACCAPAAPAAPDAPADEAPPCCGCATVPSWMLPTAVTPALDAPATSVLALLAVATISAPLPRATSTSLLLDTESPPLPADPCAHGLRAPPASA